MSREKEVLESMEIVKQAMIGDVKKPVLYLIPPLFHIALSLAAIADMMEKERGK